MTSWENKNKESGLEEYRNKKYFRLVLTPEKFREIELKIVKVTPKKIFFTDIDEVREYTIGKERLNILNETIYKDTNTIFQRFAIAEVEYHENLKTLYIKKSEAHFKKLKDEIELSLKSIEKLKQSFNRGDDHEAKEK